MNNRRLAIFLCAILSAIQIGSASAQTLESELQRVLDFELAKPDRFGASLHVDINGLGAWTVTSGIANINTNTSPNPDSRYRIGSITKTFVSALVLKLVDQGLVTLDTSIETILPGLIPNGPSISLRHLLSHTSGLKDHIDDSNNLIEITLIDNLVFHWSPQELVQIAVDLGPWSNPGNGFHYSNTGYAVLGLAVEEITGNPLAMALNDMIFEPLRLTNTSVSWDTVAADPELRAYATFDDQSILDLTEISRSFMYGAGGIVSSTTDLVRWSQLLLSGQVISSQMLAQMMNTNSTGQIFDYGLGFMEIGSDIFNRIGHRGGGFGYRAEMWYIPEQDITVITMANSIEFETGNVVIETLSVIDQLDNSGNLDRPSNNIAVLNSPTTTLGAPTTAIFSGSSFANGSSSAQSQFLETQAFDVITNIRVESGHVGKSGHIYVVVLLENGDAYGKDSTGNFYLLEKSFSNISPAEENITFPPSKDIVVFENFAVGVGSGLAGSNISIVIGYSLREAETEIYYPGEPVQISIIAAAQ